MSSADIDNIFDLIETHRAAYANLGLAEDDFDAPAEEDVTLKGAMLTAFRIERALYDALLTAVPSTVEGMMALSRHVYEVARLQDDKGHRDDGPEILAANLKGEGDGA